MQAVMILRGNEPTWAEAKRQLGKIENHEAIGFCSPSVHLSTAVYQPLRKSNK